MTTLPAPSPFDALPLATFALDATGTITAWNPAMAELTQREADLCLGSPASTCLSALGLQVPQSAGCFPLTVSTPSGDAPVSMHVTSHDDGWICQATPRPCPLDPVIGTLDTVELPLLLIGADHAIKHINMQALGLLSAYAAGFGSVVASFDPWSLLGRSIHDLLAPTKVPFKVIVDEAITEVRFGELTFLLRSCELPSGIGFVMHWEDANADATYRAEVARVRTLLADGQLDARGNPDAVGADHEGLITSLNDILDRITTPVTDATEALSRVARGDLPAPLDSGYQGAFQLLEVSINSLITVSQEIAAGAARLASGDLTASFDARSPADQLLPALETMVTRLSDNLLQVQESGQEIAQTSSQVSEASESVSDAATSAAASVEEITVTMSQLETQTLENASNATRAMELASTAATAAKEGDGKMRTMVKAMQDIETSSEDISRIIKVIDEIAFQTNLLALNAAVEAARAGTHGKGFAVVAEEVRSLAARSATAARETTDMIESSLRKVQLGTQIAHETESALGHIVEAVNEANGLVSEISVASSEQANQITNINVALSEVDGVIQQNTANAEEMAAAASQLSHQADRLDQMLASFELRELAVASEGPEAMSPEMMAAFQQFLANYQTTQ